MIMLDEDDEKIRADHVPGAVVRYMFLSNVPLPLT